MISPDDLQELSEKLLEKVDNKRFTPKCLRLLGHKIGFRDSSETIKDLIKRAKEVCKFEEENCEGKRRKWFFYRDFLFYHTETESILPWMRYNLSLAAIRTLLFYVSTPIFFCYISRDNSVCPDEGGWINAMYFASTTMSTVGYGDITVEKDSTWKVFVGTVYMILALLVTLSSLSSIVDASTARFNNLWEKVLTKVWDNTCSKVRASAVCFLVVFLLCSYVISF